MKTELEALEKNGTWSITTLPKGKKTIGSKWVYKVKFLPNGKVYRYKGHLVAKGFSQVEGVDYRDSFSPVAKKATIRIMHCIAATSNWFVEQLDINNAFLHGTLQEEIYMKIP